MKRKMVPTWIKIDKTRTDSQLRNIRIKLNEPIKSIDFTNID